jgi:hypothetical protein
MQRRTPLSISDSTVQLNLYSVGGPVKGILKRCYYNDTHSNTFCKLSPVLPGSSFSIIYDESVSRQAFAPSSCSEPVYASFDRSARAASKSRIR